MSNVTYKTFLLAKEAGSILDGACMRAFTLAGYWHPRAIMGFCNRRGMKPHVVRYFHRRESWKEAIESFPYQNPTQG